MSSEPEREALSTHSAPRSTATLASWLHVTVEPAMSEVNGPETPRRPRAAPAGPLSVALPLLWPPAHVHCRPRQAAFDPVDVSSVRDRSIGSFSQEQSYKLVSFVSNSQAAGKNLHFVLHGNSFDSQKSPDAARGSISRGTWPSAICPGLPAGDTHTAQPPPQAGDPRASSTGGARPPTRPLRSGDAVVQAPCFSPGSRPVTAAITVRG